MYDKFPQSDPVDTRNLCVECFDDDDLRQVILRHRDTGICAFCRSRKKVSIMPVRGMAEYLEGLIHANYRRAVDELPFESREGGYQGSSTFTTWEVLIENIGLPLRGPGEEELGYALAREIGDELWCSPNWTSLDPDDSLRFSWEQFCDTIKHQRRYFFQNFGKSRYGGVDDRSPMELLHEIRSIIVDENLVREVPAGLILFRARPRDRGVRYTRAAELGPPPASVAIQSNRMNPPGIPMFYGADNVALALAEIHQGKASIGEFRTTRAIRLLDLSALPSEPNFFAGGSRSRRLKLSFLRAFTADIVKPIPRDDRNHIDYLPTQVFTEFLRDVRLRSVTLDGIRYPSATGEDGSNVVLFANREAIVGVPSDDHGIFTRTVTPWIEMINVTHR